MVTLRLFRQDAPFRQIEARSFDAGELTIGRDPTAGWPIEDPERTVSRRHCAVTLEDGLLTLTDTSANGVLIGRHRERVPPGEPVAIATGESFRLGEFMILVDADGEPAPAAVRLAAPAAPSLEATTLAFDAPFNSPMLKELDIDRAALAVPADWTEPAPAITRTSRPEPAAALLDAFCAGAGLDASAFAGEDPAVLMRRLGEVYRQMVLGLADQMSERTTLKSDYRMDRTTVGAEGNNPFKWTPAHRLAVDLLCGREDGFLSGSAAAKAAFEDMKKHLLCMLAGLRAALSSTLEALSPGAVEAGFEGRSFILKNRAAAAWSEYGRLHGDLCTAAADDPDSLINRAFRAAYDRRVRELDGMDAGA